MRTKIAIVGSRVYTNNIKVKNFIFKLKEKYKDEVEIVSGGQPQGVDGYAKILIAVYVALLSVLLYA